MRLATLPPVVVAQPYVTNSFISARLSPEHLPQRTLPAEPDFAFCNSFVWSTSSNVAAVPTKLRSNKFGNGVSLTRDVLGGLTSTTSNSTFAFGTTHRWDYATSTRVLVGVWNNCSALKST
jgi:hypothetical protein